MIKKLLIIALILDIGFSANGYAQHAEIAPLTQTSNSLNPEDTNALFDPLFNYNITAEIGVEGNAGVIYVDGDFWVSEWAGNEIRVMDVSGVYIETFTVPGVTGIRSFTYDGTYVYAGNAANKIFQIDVETRQLDDVITIYSTAGSSTRMLAYDPELDGGDGGFWTGDFSSAIEAFDMDGTSLRVIPYDNHGHAIYGGAVDHHSVGGPFLWIHSQGTTSGQSQVVQISLADGQLTGVMYDYNTSGQQPAGNTSIAGGLYISEDVVPGYVTLIGLGQGTPDDQIFGVELVSSVGVEDNSMDTFNIYPNPAINGVVNIESGMQGEKQVVVYDMLGKAVINTTVADKQMNISALNAGMYMVSISQNGTTVTKKLIVK